MTLPFYSNMGDQEDSKATLGQTQPKPKPKPWRCTWHSVILTRVWAWALPCCRLQHTWPISQDDFTCYLKLPMANTHVLVSSAPWISSFPHSSRGLSSRFLWGCVLGAHCLASVKSLYKYTGCQPHRLCDTRSHNRSLSSCRLAHLESSLALESWRSLSEVLTVLTLFPGRLYTSHTLILFSLFVLSQNPWQSLKFLHKINLLLLN